MKQSIAYFLMFAMLLLSGCGQKTAVYQPTETPPAPENSALQTAVADEENQPMSRAEIAHLVNSSLLQKGSRYAKEAALRNKGFITPAEFRDRENPVLPADVKKHPLLFDITNFLSYNLRGLTVDGNNMFRPDDPLSRARFALLVEDILTLTDGDAALSTSHLGSHSPFADVNDDYFALNALITVSKENIMTADQDNRFRPDVPVTRKETKEAISRLAQLP